MTPFYTYLDHTPCREEGGLLTMNHDGTAGAGKDARARGISGING